ncbi:MAG: HAMP domain-containing sensor histidine kinase [Thermodesulfobacteriota bacterium]
MALSLRPQLRTLLLVVNVLVLLLPIGGIGLLKMYESELVRQTESALIGQAALLTSTYGQELSKRADKQHVELGYSVLLPADSLFHSFAPLIPIRPRLDVATANILPPGPSALPPPSPADEIPRSVGRQLASVLKDSQRITLCGIRLLDSTGVVVASSGSELGLSLANRQEVRRALQGYYASVLRKRISDEPAPLLSSLSRKGWLRVLVAMPVIHQQKVVGAVLLSRSPVGVGKGLYFIRKHLLLAAVVMLALVVFLSWLTTVMISRPLKKLVKQAKEVEVHGGTLAPLAHPGTMEVAELSESITEMANTLQTRADYIKNFARHVSHEFKTPITSMQGSIELIQDMGDEMSSEERQLFLNNMEEDVRHIDRLTRGLLELARADMTSPGQASCRPEQVVQEVAADYSRPGLRVRFHPSRKTAKIAMAADIFRGVIVNLLENSVQHGKASLVEITLEESGPPHPMPQLTVQDNGSGIAASHYGKIFTPFFTTARNRGGTGLGLAISKALIEGHGGEITLSDKTEIGSTFTITLPTYPIKA